MKKITILFAGLSLLGFSGCNDDENSQPEYSIVGTWKPTKEVRTSVPVSGAGVSDEIVYSACQQTGTWMFAENQTGKRTDKGEAGTPAVCSTVAERNLTYNYNKTEKNIEIKYAGTVVADQGKVVMISQDMMNVRIDDNTNPTVAKSTTYTLKRVQ